MIVIRADDFSIQIDTETPTGRPKIVVHQPSAAYDTGCILRGTLSRGELILFAEKILTSLEASNEQPTTNTD